MENGTVAGNVIGKGYRRIYLSGKLYKAQRLAWLWMTGTLPAGRISFRNGHRDDVRFSNLREVAASEVAYLQGMRTGARSGRKGALHDNRRFRARITHKGVRIHLGCFATAEAAGDAYDRKVEELRGDLAPPMRRRTDSKSRLGSAFYQAILATTAIQHHEDRRTRA